MQERVHTLWDFVDFASYFYVEPDYATADEKYKSKHLTDESKARLTELLPKLDRLTIGITTTSSASRANTRKQILLALAS